MLIAAIVCLLGSISYYFLNENYQQQSQTSQQRAVRLAARYFERTWSADTGKIDSECKTLFRDSPMWLTVIDAADGRVLGDSRADPGRMVNHRTEGRPEVLEALAGGDGRHVRSSETLGTAFRYFAQPIRQGDKVVGLVRVAMPVRAIVEGTSLIRDVLIGAAIGAGIVAVALGLLLSWIWSSPLRQITRAAGRIASGNLSLRVRVAGPRELIQLGIALNEMRGNLARQIDQIAAERRDLETVLVNLREGVVALDAEGMIVLMNDWARALLNATDSPIEGKPLQEVVRIADVVETLGEVRQSGLTVHKQIEIEGPQAARTLEVVGVPVEQDSPTGIHAMLVVRDITELVRIAAVKAEFAANASHELRTPLATIRAAVDSLASVDPSSRAELEHIRDILDRHTDRLVELTNDLLDLHLIETARRQLELEAIDIASLAQWVTDSFSQPAQDKSLTLNVSPGESTETFASDRTLLRLILQNLTDNAIKFTPPGGQVDCLLQQTDGQLWIRVRDTGCGIPPDLHDRVFERFFQADASRSGRARSRGTGLGLAIVKHAVERLRGQVHLDSEAGKGATFAVSLPALVEAKG